MLDTETYRFIVVSCLVVLTLLYVVNTIINWSSSSVSPFAVPKSDVSIGAFTSGAGLRTMGSMHSQPYFSGFSGDGGLEAPVSWGSDVDARRNLGLYAQAEERARQQFGGGTRSEAAEQMLAQVASDTVRQEQLSGFTGARKYRDVDLTSALY